MTAATGKSVPDKDAADLLGRSPTIAYSRAAQAMIRGRRILVTGAGGSIGSELIRQLHALEPAALFLLDHDESSMHGVQLELYGHGQLDHERTVLADIRDRSRLIKLLRDLRPDIVYHAAAHKHLAILERYPSEAIRTNVLGTENVVVAARAAGAGRFILVSTDKAANPSSVLGASKRLAEMLTRTSATPGFRTASVRFGNVLGSRGSFLETLSHQMRVGRPVTVTDPEVERYFMTIPEAAALVVEATVMASSGETYLLDMGDPVRILDLVKRYATLRNVPEPGITFTGLVPGEKLSEHLIDTSETLETTPHPKIWRVPAADTTSAPTGGLALLYEAAATHDELGVISELRHAGFRVGRDPIPAPVDLRTTRTGVAV